MKVRGLVVRGIGKGKKLGFPTANLIMDQSIPSGVYRGKASYQSKDYLAAIYSRGEGKILEVHLINFSGDLYAKLLTVEIAEKIRDVIKFENEDEAKDQIKKDIEKML